MLKRSFLVLIVLCLSLVACTSADPTPVPINAISPSQPTQQITQQPTQTAAATNTQPSTQVASPSPTDTVAPSPTTPQATGELSLSAERIYIYPVPQLYTNDRVTFQVFANVPSEISAEDVTVAITIDGNEIIRGPMGRGSEFSVSPYGLFQWAWNAGGEPGDHTVTVTLDPDNVIQVGDADSADNQASLTINVQPREALPASQANSRWETHSTAYANIHVVTGTAAHRDISLILTAVDRAIPAAAARLGVIPQEKLNIFFIDRVIGQGGYASRSVVISYPDRNYAGGALESVLTHEAIHVLDNQIISNEGFRFAVEGIAVWGAGGHYKQENLDQRAAALLLDTPYYVPLEQLINNFYPAQHEIGYLEAGSFFGYLVNTYGWDSVRAFYTQLVPEANKPLADTFSENMTFQFGKTLTQLETSWHAYLRTTPRTATDAQDLMLTIEYYDLMRRYQQAYDPTAYFRTAWLPYPDNLIPQNSTADLTRHPNREVNIVFETMLESADKALRAGNYDRTRALLQSVDRALQQEGRFLDPLAANYQQLVRLTAGLGLEAQAITLDTSSGTPRATVVASDRNLNSLNTFSFSLDGQQWSVSQ